MAKYPEIYRTGHFAHIYSDFGVDFQSWDSGPCHNRRLYEIVASCGQGRKNTGYQRPLLRDVAFSSSPGFFLCGSYCNRYRFYVFSPSGFDFDGPVSFCEPLYAAADG